MKRNLIGELTIMKQLNIKPNFSALSREYGIDRHTIKKYYDQGGIKRKLMKRSSFCDNYHEEILDLLSSPEVSYRAAYEFLRFKYSSNTFTLTYSGFRSHCLRNHLREKAMTIENVHVRFETPPGKQLQLDWKEDLHIETVDGETLHFHLLVCTLGYSRFHTFVYSETKTTEDFIRCLIETLKMIGGLPKEILTDNMSAIVHISSNGSRKKYPIILQLEKDLGIEINLCKPRTPQTKGKDESANRFVNWLKAYDKRIKDLQELFEVLDNLNKRVNEEINQTTKVPPLTLFKKEKEYLTSLPNKLLLENYVVNVSTQKVPTTLLVNYLGKGYSVPKRAIGKSVKLVPIDNMLYIYLNTELLCTHILSQDVFNYQKEHYLEALRTRLKDHDNDDIEKMAEENLRLLKKVGG